MKMINIRYWYDKHNRGNINYVKKKILRRIETKGAQKTSELVNYCCTRPSIIIKCTHELEKEGLIN